jgi:hypothetical protein
MPRRPRPVFSLDSAMVTTVESRSHGVNEDSLRNNPGGMACHGNGIPGMATGRQPGPASCIGYTRGCSSRWKDSFIL